MRLTIQCGVVRLTNFKKKILDKEYNNIQDAIQLSSNDLEELPLFENLKLYSANKQQATRYFKKYKYIEQVAAEHNSVHTADHKTEKGIEIILGGILPDIGY